MKINFDKDFEKNTLALFKKMIAENITEAKTEEPFSLPLIITDNEPEAYLLSFKDEVSGKKGYVVFKKPNTKP